MDEFIGNLKTHELKKIHGQDKKKVKKMLSLKASKYESSEKDTDVYYLTKKIVKAMKRSGQFQRKGNNSKK